MCLTGWWCTSGWRVFRCAGADTKVTTEPREGSRSCYEPTGRLASFWIIVWVSSDRLSVHQSPDPVSPGTSAGGSEAGERGMEGEGRRRRDGGEVSEGTRETAANRSGGLWWVQNLSSLQETVPANTGQDIGRELWGDWGH